MKCDEEFINYCGIIFYLNYTLLINKRVWRNN